MPTIQENEEWFSIEEIMEITDLSKETVYRRITKDSLENKDYITSISTGGIRNKLFRKGFVADKYKEYYRTDLDFSKQVNATSETKEETSYTSQDKSSSESSSNQSIIELLRQQLEAKDDQLKEKDTQISRLHDQIEKQSNLMQNEQTLRLQQNQILLESKSTKSGGFFGFFKGKPKVTEEKDL